ncbi:16S rRNA (guanine(527)-N(7))-methyltransferase RsmG [Acidocella aromatica]|uniref:Ribosomal RNA small subunit methyltransferase G n=1 Tax=Acidocella aromatica TaxID=1303579 RepID=A0A840VD10_9PROT|nr:16S rRNA (guanine(527)-N(7))-methyltransferase RsmG [Acidocella aromatica]MBB5373584.1 16S rRNA (guanine527-N7)-methyltransferase [Acidocella aromatica]
MNEDKLRQFAALVEKWSAKINLVSKSDLPHIWERHVQDSLRLVPYIPAGTSRAIDIGSGAGFPGLVLAIATGIPFDLVESDIRKAAFLREAARITGAPAKIHNARIEAGGLEPAPLVTARALAPLDKLLGLASPLLAPDGVCLFPKGRGWEAELTAAKALWHMQAERISAPGWGESCILKVSQIRHAG